MSRDQKTQVLYIEDDEHLCLLFMERMQEDGYSVDFALSAEAGLNKFHSGFYQ
jgi:DNA-binding response OmpR family regulator